MTTAGSASPSRPWNDDDGTGVIWNRAPVSREAILNHCIFSPCEGFEKADSKADENRSCEKLGPDLARSAMPADIIAGMAGGKVVRKKHGRGQSRALRGQPIH